MIQLQLRRCSGYLLVFSIFYFLFSNTVSAASFRLYFSLPETPIWAGQEFAVKIMAASDQSINAYVVHVSYDSSALQFIGSDNSRSIIDVWQAQPLVSGSGNIQFKGASLHPFRGDAGELMALRFRGTGVGSSTLYFVNSSLYLANGKGTKVIPDTQTAQCTVVAQQNATSSGNNSGSLDTASPQITFLSFVNDPFNANQKFLSFLVSDRGSGIKNISYRYRTWFFWSKPEMAIDPAALPRLAWSAALEVSDNNGNIARATIYDWRAFAKIPLPVLVLGALILLFAVHKARKRKRDISGTIK